MSWPELVRWYNFIVGVAMLFITIRVVREQLRRAWGDAYQYLRFFVLGGWCFVFGSTAIDRRHQPLTWRTYAATVLLTLSLVAIIGMRRQQRAVPPTKSESGLAIGRIRKH